MKNVQQFEEERNNFCDAIEQFTDSYIILKLGSRFIDTVLTYLSDVMRDNDDWICWWLYEDVEKVICYKNEELTLDTVEKLYDFLIQNYESVTDEEEIISD